MTINSSFWAGRRVLLTGHTGFKGSWLMLWLQQLGSCVWGYSLEPDKNQSLFRELYAHALVRDKLYHCQADLADTDQLEQWVQSCQPEVVLHLAAQPLVLRSYADPVGTWNTNVLGSLRLLEALKKLDHPCAVVMVTTDKVYHNNESTHGYCESDRLGGHDPYSASKAAAELAVESWRSSFCGTSSHQTPFLQIATARAGNVIGGGDWADNRIVPDAIRSLISDSPIVVRNPNATRPWQHVLEPLCGYLNLAEKLASDPDPPCEAFNFGPRSEATRSVKDLIETITSCWPGKWRELNDIDSPHEAMLLHLQINKAESRLDWHPHWDYDTSVSRTVGWYKANFSGVPALDCCLEDLRAYSII